MEIDTPGVWTLKRTESLYQGKATFVIADRVVEVANRLGVRPAQVSLAWLLNKEEITSPIVGVSRVEQLEELLGAASMELDSESQSYLEEPYQPVENLLSIGTS